MNRTTRWLLIALTACLATALTVSLGFWQLRRAAQKEALASQIQKAETRPSLSGAALTSHSAVEPLLHQPVLLRGQWVPERTVYLDNRQMQAKVGFYVLTPLRLQGSDQVLMVQRGWIPRNFVARERLPDVQTAHGIVEISGRIALPPSKLYEPGAASLGPIRQNLDLQLFRLETGLALRTDLSIVQTGTASEGLLREWPAIHLGVDKHYGYALQWFALAALILGLFAWFQLRPFLASSKDSFTHV
nr:SURF1 family protein [uncultured Rhodoferax sp.]